MRDRRTTNPKAAAAWERLNAPDADPRGDGIGADDVLFAMSTDDGPLVELWRRMRAGAA